MKNRSKRVVGRNTTNTETPRRNYKDFHETMIKIQTLKMTSTVVPETSKSEAVAAKFATTCVE